MSRRQTSFIIDNATDGFSLHDTESGNIIRSFATKPTRSYPKQVALADRECLVVGGGERGTIHVFEKSTGEKLQELQHGRSGMVQAVTVGCIKWT